ncbi:DUF4148 domain-containing protein [Ramlibacter sp. XY19]|uniref:DUF4148 domain-containing protein n=1 Tax=Ramlibacter paludis TaxID=2908000 RepID=UPI0023DC26BE|nr:DUF4148 domain-containing protein [Ramlibacter paludis]MCG2594386.1 DUF4148 domain-containing protein [Ramlibacter paludis]
MNRNIAFAFVLATAAAAGTAFADDITLEPTQFVSTLTRAEVRAEMQQARAAGTGAWAPDYDQLAGFRSERSRADVTADYTAERDHVAALNGEDSGSVYLARSDMPQPIRVAAAR